jgi:hypothetical protein
VTVLLQRELADAIAIAMMPVEGLSIAEAISDSAVLGLKWLLRAKANHVSNSLSNESSQ